MQNRSHESAIKRTSQSHPAKKIWILIRIGRWLMLGVFSLGVILTTIFLIGPSLGYDLIQADAEPSTLVLPLVTNQSQSNLLIVHTGRDIESSYVWIVDGTLAIDVPGGYGQYQLGAIWPLLNIDTKDATYQRAVFSFVLHQPIEQVIPIQTQSDLIGWPLLVQVLKVLITNPNYSGFDRWLLLKTCLIMRSDLPSQVIQVHHYDELIATLRFDPPAFTALADECGIAIMNATELGGLASQYGQILESNGAYVVRIDDAGQALDKSFIILDSKHQDVCLPVGRMLSQLLPFEIEITRASDVYQTYRTPVAVLLGQDVVEFLETY